MSLIGPVRVTVVALCIALLALTGCAHKNRQLQQSSPEVLYKKAKKALNSYDYNASIKTYEQLTALPATDVTTDIHCVTRWSRFDAQFKGVHWNELAKLSRPKPSARFAIAHAEQGFTANVPLAAIEDEHALIVYEADGAPLTPDHGWPVRLFVPSKYFWKSAKWLRGIELSPVDKPGFWERYGYHNDADYWQEQRYGF